MVEKGKVLVQWRAGGTMVEKGKSYRTEVMTTEYTINLHKHLHGCTFEKMAPKAFKEIKKFPQKAMRTTNVRLDVKLNKVVWSRGIRSVPRRIRVRISRKCNNEEDAKEELHSTIIYFGPTLIIRAYFFYVLIQVLVQWIRSNFVPIPSYNPPHTPFPFDDFPSYWKHNSTDQKTLHQSCLSHQ